MTHSTWAIRGRRHTDRAGLRYPSDLTDQEWVMVESLIPPARGGGNKRTVDLRQVVNGLAYVLSMGCQWSALPRDLPPRTTLNEYFRRWNHDHTLIRIHQALYRICLQPDQHPAAVTEAAIRHPSGKDLQHRTPRSVSPAAMRDANPSLGNTAPC